MSCQPHTVTFAGIIYSRDYLLPLAVIHGLVTVSTTGLFIVLAVSHGLVTVLKMSQGPVNKSEELLFDKHKKGLLPLTLALNHVQSTSHAPPATASVNQSTSHEPHGPRVRHSRGSHLSASFLAQPRSIDPRMIMSHAPPATASVNQGVAI